MVGLTLVLVVEGAKVVVITPVGDKDIGNEFQDRGLPSTSLSKEKDRVWCFHLILGQVTQQEALKVSLLGCWYTRKSKREERRKRTGGSPS